MVSGGSPDASGSRDASPGDSRADHVFTDGLTWLLDGFEHEAAKQ
ncbi:hypothetical protein [Rathayibacter soli]|nr:hypothetical protein [Glaciibacter superstes]